MKKKVLALTLALFMLAAAIPAGAIGMVEVETADEAIASAETADAEVMAVKTTGEYKPGLNFLTGTTNAETFNDYTVTEDYGTGVFPENGDSIIKARNAAHSLRVTSDGAGNNYAEVAFAGGDWTNGGIAANAIDTNFGRPAYFFVMAKHVGGGDPQLNVVNKSMIGSLPNHTNTVHSSKVSEASYNQGWRCYELNASAAEPQYAFGYDDWNNPNQSTIFSVHFQYSWNETETDKAKIHWDNLAFVPYYKVTYKNIAKNGTPTGNDTVKYFLGTTGKIAVDIETGAITGLPTAYPVDFSVTLPTSNGFAFKGWSTIDGATEPMTEIPLDNEDIILYPVWGEAITYNFVTPEGDYAFYSVSANPAAFTFPAAEDMGIAYEPKFSDGKNVYYSGERYYGEAFEFTVYNSYVIYSEKFDDEALSDEAVTATTDYMNWGTTKFAFANHAISECDGSKAAYKKITAAGWQGSGVFSSNMYLNSPGVYTFRFDVTATGNEVPSIDVYCDTENSSLPGNHLNIFSIRNASRKQTVEFSAKIYRDAANKLAIEMLSGSDAGATGTFTWSSFDSFRLTYNVYNAPAENDDVRVCFDNFTIEYKPFSPATVKKASCRDTAPLGIRFASYITDSVKNLVANYGFIAALKDSLSSNDLLTLDGITVTADGEIFGGINTNGVKLIGAVAYNSSDIDKVFATDGSVFGSEYRCIFDIFFACSLVNIPEGKESTVFVVRPFVEIDGKYYYGDFHEASYDKVMNGSDTDADLGDLWQ